MKIIKIQDYRNMGFVAREDGIDGYLTNNDEVLSGGAVGLTNTTDGRMVLNNGASGTVKMGPFLDSTDGKTPETGLSIDQGDVYLSKNEADFITKADTGSAAHDENGFYDVPLNGTDTNAQGNMIVYIHVAGALPVWRFFEVKDNPA